MSGIKVSADQLAKAVVRELEDWSFDVTKGVKEDVRTVSTECKNEIKQNSPVDVRNTARRGRYKKGWKSKVSYEDDFDIRITIYNPTDYQLAHLLEYGHEVVKNGRVVGHYNGKPHIRPAEENAEKKLMKKVTVRVKKNEP